MKYLKPMFESGYKENIHLSKTISVSKTIIYNHSGPSGSKRNEKSFLKESIWI